MPRQRPPRTSETAARNRQKCDGHARDWHRRVKAGPQEVRYRGGRRVGSLAEAVEMTTICRKISRPFRKTAHASSGEIEGAPTLPVLGRDQPDAAADQFGLAPS